jgi:hypothetical protein
METTRNHGSVHTRSVVGSSTTNANNVNVMNHPNTLAPRKNIRQPDMGLELERRVTQRRKTKDDFEIDSPNCSSTASSSTTNHTSQEGSNANTDLYVETTSEIRTGHSINTNGLMHHASHATNMAPVSAGPSTPTIRFSGPGPLDITSTTQLPPPQRYALCPSPTYFALDQGGSPISMSLYNNGGPSIPPTPMFEELPPRSPFASLPSPTISRSTSNASLSAASQASRTVSPLASPALHASIHTHGSTTMNRPSPLALTTTISPEHACVKEEEDDDDDMKETILHTSSLEQDTSMEDVITSPIDRCPAEVMLRILSYLPLGTQRQCIRVSRRWHNLVSYIMYYSPRLSTMISFERLVDTLIAGHEAALKDDTDTIKSHNYTHLVRRMDLAHMDEQFRCAPGLSRQLSRVIPHIRQSLRALNLGFCKGARNYDLQRLAPMLSNLTLLNLSGGGRTDIVVSKIVKHCPRLQRLSIAWNGSISDFGCAEIANCCPRLRVLDLTCCTGITDTGILAIIEGCRDLSILGIAYCNNVGDIAVREAVLRLTRYSSRCCCCKTWYLTI